MFKTLLPCNLRNIVVAIPCKERLYSAISMKMWFFFKRAVHVSKTVEIVLKYLLPPLPNFGYNLLGLDYIVHTFKNCAVQKMLLKRYYQKWKYCV